MATFLAAVALANGPRVIAQTASTNRAFVDVSIAGDRNPVDDFHGTPDGHAIRATVGKPAGHHDWRLEVDVPTWRITDSDYTGPMYCAKDSSCGPGVVPARFREHMEVRTVSAGVLYAQHLPTFGRVGVSLVGGGAIESQVLKYSQQTDILDAAGRVVSHNAYAHDYPVGTISGVIGVD